LGSIVGLIIPNTGALKLPGLASSVLLGTTGAHRALGRNSAPGRSIA